MLTGTQWQNVVSTISHMCGIVDTMFCHCGSVTLCYTVYISGGIEHQVCNNTVYNIRQLGGGGGGRINGVKILWVLSLPECFAFSQFLLHPSSMSGRWHRKFNMVMRATGEYTTMCVVGVSPDTLQTLPHRLSSPGKNWCYWPSSTCEQAEAVTHPSTNRGQFWSTCRIWLPTICAMPSHHWPCNTLLIHH